MEKVSSASTGCRYLFGDGNNDTMISQFVKTKEITETQSVGFTVFFTDHHAITVADINASERCFKSFMLHEYIIP